MTRPRGRSLILSPCQSRPLGDDAPFDQWQTAAAGKRTVDHRAGDELMFEQRWERTVEMEVFTGWWFTGEQLPPYAMGGDGYVYRPVPQPDSLPKTARIGSKRTREKVAPVRTESRA
ncbi:hypothetical protein [Lacipirellula limnantheis]|uniref:Uncharacterized protein n=1 Tax=Lacipirellula limnantheis TaxID=2528024 RepID=A0A517TXW8_9BACT|nr:hypothetical protein [Lacipirellula limnantheis]QDT73224.1 hypothetical protein I41_24130 [Lacipirellula limnantheis]